MPWPLTEVSLSFSFSSNCPCNYLASSESLTAWWPIPKTSIRNVWPSLNISHRVSLFLPLHLLFVCSFILFLCECEYWLVHVRAYVCIGQRMTLGIIPHPIIHLPHGIREPFIQQGSHRVPQGWGSRKEVSSPSGQRWQDSERLYGTESVFVVTFRNTAICREIVFIT